jgi:putative MATE family efflux protein
VDDHGLTGGRPSSGATPIPPPLAPEFAAPESPVEHAEPRLLDLQRPIWRLVLTLAWPALLQQALVLIVNLWDSYLAGRLQGVTAEEQITSQAAQTTAFYLAWFVSSYTVLVTVGSTTLVAYFIGAGDHRSAIHATNQSLLLAVVAGLAGSFLAVLGLPALIAALNLHGEAAAFATDYLRPLFWLLVFQVIEAAGIACLIGAGDTRTGLWLRTGVALINVPLAWSFQHGWGPIPRLGFAGIALGTAVSNVIGGVAVLAILWRGRAGLCIRLDMLAPCWNLLGRLLRISVPAALDSLSVVVGQLWFLSIVNGLDMASKAAHGIALRWEALGYLSGGAFGTAAITLVGQNLGAGSPERARRSGWTAFGLGGAIMVLMGALFYVLAGPMFHLFCPAADQQPIVNVGVPVLRLVAFAMPALASCIIFTSALRGAGDTRVPMLFTWFGFFALRIPLAYFLTQEHVNLGPLGTWPGYPLGLLGAWLAMFADLYARGLFFLLRFVGGRWQRMRI